MVGRARERGRRARGKRESMAGDGLGGLVWYGRNVVSTQGERKERLPGEGGMERMTFRDGNRVAQKKSVLYL